MRPANHQNFKKLPVWIFVLLLPLICMGQNVRHLTIDPMTEYQTIDNFGASDCWSMQKVGAWSTLQKEKIADLLFSPTLGIGLSGWRFNIGAGINTSTIAHPWRTVETFEVSEGVYDWSRQANERWFLNAARERGVSTFIAFVNSPPGRMTRNGVTNCTDGLGSTNLKEGFEGQFARYLGDILEYFRDNENLAFDYISPLNEPNWEWNSNSNQEGNRASNDDIAKIVDSLYVALNDRSLDTEIMLSESGDLHTNFQYDNGMENEYGETYGNYLASFFGNSDVNSKISNHIGSHSYWSDLLNNELVEHRQALKLKLIPYFFQGFDYWVTEYTILEGPTGAGGHGRDLSINTALNVARVIHFDLTILDASAWQWWTAVSPENFKDGLIYTDYFNPGDPESIIPSKTLWALGNYSRYIRPGAKRIQISGANDKNGLMATAYKDENESKLIVVLVNVGFNTETISLNVAGLDSPAVTTTFTPFVTSDLSEDNLKEYPGFAADSSFQVPARSIVTLTGQLAPITSIDNRGTQTPKSFTLEQNYPNPFNSSTNILFTLPESSIVTLSIYDIRGNLIRKILNREKLNSGVYRTDWDGKNQNGVSVATGIYLFSLSANNFRSTQKMMLLK